MPAIEREPLEQVLRGYDIKVLGVRNESYKDKKGVWWIQTPQGSMILKKLSYSEETLRHILHATRHLTGNGINMPAIFKTKAGKEYMIIDGVCFVLSEAIKGKNPSYNSPHELSKIVRELARFHAASLGFVPDPESKPKVHLGTWIQDYEEQLEDMNGFYHKEASKETRDAVGELIVKEFPHFYKRGLEAVNGLKGHEYSEWVEKAAKAGCLCHQDFAAGNLIMDDAGSIYILDTDSLTVDIPARDIRKLLNKIMKKEGRWDADLTSRIIKHYQAENPLSRSEWMVVKLDLIFPHLFIGAMNKYCYKREKEWNAGKYLQRLKEMAAFEKTAECVLNHFESMADKVL